MAVAMLDTILNAVFIGMGSAIGTYLANKGLTAHMDKLLKRLEAAAKAAKSHGVNRHQAA